MLRGMTTFTCDVCGHTFRAMDVKLGVSTFSVPVSCPNSGSRHTMPKSQFSSKEIYRKIWEQFEK